MEATIDTRTSRPGGWLREPLLHFLLIGAALFVLFRVLNGGDTGAPRDIVISEARVEALAENFARTWLRPPTAEELRGLVDDHIAEEVNYREAIAMGLDRDATAIRRRLRQKMEFISEDVAAAVETTDAELQAYLGQHAEKFVEPPRFTFEQVFLSSEQRGDAVRRDAERLLDQLVANRAPASPAELGDPTLLPPGFGLHLVRVGARRVPAWHARPVAGDLQRRTVARVVHRGGLRREVAGSLPRRPDRPDGLDRRAERDADRRAGARRATGGDSSRRSLPSRSRKASRSRRRRWGWCTWPRRRSKRSRSA